MVDARPSGFWHSVMLYTCKESQLHDFYACMLSLEQYLHDFYDR